MTPIRFGIIGGSGLYKMEGLEDMREIAVDTPYGAPSDAIATGTLDGVPVAFLARHGRSHSTLPGDIPFRANIWALKSLGVDYLVSVSAVGSLKEALAPLGTVWFGGVAMQPGKPQGFGVVGEQQIPIFTLPGNPVSSYLSFQMFVLPALRTMMGRRPASPPVVRARLTHDIRSPAGRRQFVRAEWDEDGSVTPVGGHGSHLIGDLATASCLIEVAADVTSVRAGEMVAIRKLDEEF